MRQNIDRLFDALARSSFRSRFHLSPREREYVNARTRAGIARHAHDIIDRRLAPAKPLKDGRQTPYRGHPVFVAQHATATCCRSCLEKWHHIPRGIELTPEQRDYVVGVLLAWMDRDLAAEPLR